MALNKAQAFEITTIPRNRIKNAPYNPRVIGENARKRLSKGIKKFGLVETLVWNKRTGNLVSGHQRLSIIDEMEKTKDYEITVSVIDVSEKDEMALNVQLNNQSMMGDFDLDALAQMAEQGASIDDFGFSDSDVDVMFGDSDFAERFCDSKALSEEKDELREIKKDRKEFVDRLKDQNNASFYFTVVCESMDEREELFQKMGVPFSEEFVSSDALRRLCD